MIFIWVISYRISQKSSLLKGGCIIRTITLYYKYFLLEYPFVLCYQVGDPKDTVRNGVKALFRQICVVYSVTKLFGYLMEGLKSKNARQRAGEYAYEIYTLIQT